MRLFSKLHIVPVLLGVLIALGCSGQQAKPFTYQAPDEIAEGPGVFSKDKGEFTLYDSKKKNPKESEATTRSANPSESTASTSPSTHGAESNAAAPQSLDNDESFKQFKEWQQDQAEFEEFKKWKETQAGSAEYEEFQQWKRWKEYQKWQQQQPGQPENRPEIRY